MGGGGGLKKSEEGFKEWGVGQERVDNFLISFEFVILMPFLYRFKLLFLLYFYYDYFDL